MSKYFKTKHEKDSARITSLIAILLILLIFIVGPKYMDPPIEYGVAVNFGTSNVGSGNKQPLKPIKSEPVNVNKEPKVSESKPSEPVSTPNTEEVLTEENEEAIAIKKQKEAEAQRKAEAEAKAKAEAERKAKEQEIDDILSGISKSDGEVSGSEGNDSKPGDIGNLNGFYKPYDGIPGLGNGGVGYGLNDRGRPRRGKVEGCENEYGKVVVDIIVNQNGDVIEAEAGTRGTTFVTDCLKRQAEKLARTFKWPADPKAPIRQLGKIVVNFVSGN